MAIRKTLSDDLLQLQVMAVDAAANAIVITDRDGIILSVNPAFTRLTGFSAAEAIGHTPGILKSGDRIDPIRRISDVVPVVNLSGALGWRTRAEHERSPNSLTMRMSQEPATVSLTPARRHRAALSQDAQAVAEDLAALLERRMRP